MVETKMLKQNLMCMKKVHHLRKRKKVVTKAVNACVMAMFAAQIEYSHSSEEQRPCRSVKGKQGIIRRHRTQRAGRWQEQNA